VQDFNCIVSAELFARATLCQAKEVTRYYLNGVHVEPSPAGGALLIATDGHCMVVLHDPAAIVSGSAIVALTPAMLKACRARQARFDPADRVVVVCGQAAGVLSVTEREDPAGYDLQGVGVACYQPHSALIDGSFPDWRRVVPSSQCPEKPQGVFDPKVIARVAEALGVEAGKGVAVISSGGPNDPHFVRALFPAPAFGIAMPLRSDATLSVAHDWAGRIEAKVAA
jgi:hypothetical protein